MGLTFKARVINIGNGEGVILGKEDRKRSDIETGDSLTLTVLDIDRSRREDYQQRLKIKALRRHPRSR